MMGEGTNTLPHSGHESQHGAAATHSDDHSGHAHALGEEAPAGLPPAAVPTGTFAVSNPAPGATASIPMGAFTFSGTGAAGSKVILFGDGAEMASGSVAADGTWALPVTFAPPAPEKLQISLFAADGTKLGSEDISFEFPPGSREGNPSDAKFALLRPVDQGSVAVGDWVIAGTGKPGAKVKLQMDKYVLGLATVAEDGTWRFPRTIQKAGEARVLSALVENGAPEEKATHTIKVLP